MRGFLILLVIAAAVCGVLYWYGGSFKLPPKSPPAATETPAPAPVAVTPTAAASPVVDIARGQVRAGANGGSAVVLFTDTPDVRDRNTVACLDIWDVLDPANTDELKVGQRKGADGATEQLRPLYWTSVTPLSTGEHGCDERMAKYDYARAATLRAKYGLTNAGPYLLVARADETAIATIDMTGLGDREIADLARYYRDGFAYEGDIWDPARVTRQPAAMATFFGARFQDSLAVALGFVANPAAHAGCPLGDLADPPCT